MIEQVLTAVLSACLLAGCTPFISRVAAKAVHDHNKRDAYERLIADPHVYVGAICRAIYVHDRPEPLVPRCLITSLRVGRMVVRILDKNHPDYGCEHSFTGLEFERLDPRMEV